MKRRSTTPVASSSRGLVARSTLVAAAVLMATTTPLAISQSAVATDYDSQISALQKKIDGANAQAGKYAAQADTLKEKVNQIAGKIQAVKTLIAASEKKAALLEQQIKDTQEKLATNKEALGKTMASMYVDGQTTPLEMLASSQNIGNFLDKQAYQSSINNKLSKTIDAINELEAKLKKQQTEVRRTLADQKHAKAELAEQQAKQASLLKETRGKESKYQKISSAAAAQKRSVQEQQQAAIQAALARSSNNGGGGGRVTGGGSYGSYVSWLSRSAPNCYVDANAISNTVDPLGYGCKQCVSFAAYMMVTKTGYGPSYWGNANMWPSAARGAGFKVDGNARANSLAVMYVGQYGHIAYVQSVSGGMMHIQQYNYLLNGQWGQYSEMDVSTSAYQQFIHL